LGWLASVPKITREDAMSGCRQEIGDVSEEKAHAA